MIRPGAPTSCPGLRRVAGRPVGSRRHGTLPFRTTRGSLDTGGITVYASESVTVTPPAGQGSSAALEAPLGALRFRDFPQAKVPLDGTEFTLHLDNRTVEDLYVAVRWGCTMPTA